VRGEQGGKRERKQEVGRERNRREGAGVMGVSEKEGKEGK